MSADVRQTLADAASTVEGVSVSPYFRQSTKPGDGMVRFDRAERDSTGHGFIDTWWVVVMLPKDTKSAEQWIEAKTPALIGALESHLIIIRFSPQQLALDTGTTPVLIFEGKRERD